MITQTDYFGHWGYAFLALGMFYLSHKEKVGWAFRFFGEAIWVILGYTMGMTSIWMWGLLFMVIDLIGFIRWQEAEKLANPGLCMHGNEGECPECLGTRVEYKGKFSPVFCAMNGVQHSTSEDCSYCRDYTEDFTPDCTGEEHQPYCREYKKVKVNGKNKTKQRKSKSKKAATKSRKAPNRKARVRGRRHSKSSNGKSRR